MFSCLIVQRTSGLFIFTFSKLKIKIFKKCFLNKTYILIKESPVRGRWPHSWLFFLLCKFYMLPLHRSKNDFCPSFHSPSELSLEHDGAYQSLVIFCAMRSLLAASQKSEMRRLETYRLTGIAVSVGSETKKRTVPSDQFALSSAESLFVKSIRK